MAVLHFPMETIYKYFSVLSPVQEYQLKSMKAIYSEWNARINVISRKDMDNFMERHVLHSLAIAKIIQFVPGTRILDAGTGGGFPGIPLAILFPECELTLVDSIGKKIKVVNEVKQVLGLKNVTAIQSRVEEVRQTFDFIVSRAVTTLTEFTGWIGNKIDSKSLNLLTNGVLYLKGGEIQPELEQLIKWHHTIFNLKSLFDEEFFETKKLVHLYK
jgi:16S rRNA (guanine527-N7)-methyltransferase